MFYVLIFLALLLSLVCFLLFRSIGALDSANKQLEIINEEFENNFNFLEDLLKRRSEYAVDDDVIKLYGLVGNIYNFTLGYLNDNNKEKKGESEEEKLGEE